MWSFTRGIWKERIVEVGVEFGVRQLLWPSCADCFHVVCGLPSFGILYPLLEDLAARKPQRAEPRRSKIVSFHWSSQLPKGFKQLHRFIYKVE